MARKLALGQPVPGQKGDAHRVDWSVNALKEVERWSHDANAGAFGYDNTTTGLVARNVQDAIDQTVATGAQAVIDVDTAAQGYASAAQSAAASDATTKANAAQAAAIASSNATTAASLANYTTTASLTTLLAAKLAAASAADQETATSNTVGVTPGVQQRHPSSAKCWACIDSADGSPSLAASYNITSLTDVALGDVTITIATDFSSANWTPHATIQRPTTAGSVVVTTKAAGSVELLSFNAADSAADPNNYYFVGYGDQ